MKLDVQMLFMLVGIGLISRKLDWRGWLLVAVLIVTWMVYNLIKSF
jgi:hypothetical protein